MTTQPPIACSLTASQLPVRLAEIAALGADALLDAHQHGTRAELRFTPGAAVRERVDAIVAAEARCCAFLAMRVTDAPGAVRLSIDAPAAAEPVLREMLAAFRGARPAG